MVHDGLQRHGGGGGKHLCHSVQLFDEDKNGMIPCQELHNYR